MGKGWKVNLTGLGRWIGTVMRSVLGIYLGKDIGCGQK